ncbi:putative glycerophosphoryl diester phosphodiesterase 1 [Gimesia maris]|uniref:glycerophosphodiester phosphodiesterase n=1 Tax=Gimesia maris TaxID=122 RepID=UPI00118BBCCB|nr:glycerophosphodiester phosphodiesterase family protein [Gimesia maris]QDT80966.1 putative glycerophosphoryl diester phosphodiesterase 1 [Gimesia maris]
MKRYFPFLILIIAAACLPVDVHSATAGEPLIVAHRGLLRVAPENTLANFRACLELRLGFEFDVQRSKDGHLVCIHDSTLNRTTNGSGKVADLTLAEIRQLDAGSWFDPRFQGERVPTVEEVLQLAAQYRQHEILIAVDFKDPGVEQEVVELAKKQGILKRLIFIGRTIQNPLVRKNIKAASLAAETAAVANNKAEFSAALSEPDADWVYVRYLPTRSEMQQVHAAGKKSFIAGSSVSGNVPQNWQQATAAGIDAILTDYPLALRALQQQSQLKSDD